MVQAKCKNLIAKPEFIKAKAGIPNAGKLTCKDLPDEPCFCYDGKDFRKVKLGLIDNPNSQKYAKKNIVICSDQDSCQGALLALDCTLFAEGTFGVINKDFTEVYCAEPNGFNKMEGLVADAAGIDQADNDDIQKATDQTTRDTAKGPRETVLLTCVQDSKNPTLTPDQIKDCIGALVREILGTKVAPADL